MALVPCRDADARRALEHCFDSAHAASDSAGERLAAAGAVIAIAADFADFRKLPVWLERLRATRRASWPRCDRPQDQARLDAALVCIPLLDGGIAADEPCIEAAAVRLAGLLAGDLPVTPDERMLLWKCLVDYRSHRLDTTELARITAKAQDFMRGNSVSPLWQARWWLLVARAHDYFGAHDAAADSLRRAHALADEHALTSVRYELLCVEMTAALKAEAWGRADALAKEIEILLPDVSAGRHRAGYYAQAWRLMWRGELEAALLRIDRVLAICDDLQVPLRDRGTYYVLRAYALMGLGRFDEAARDLESQRPHQLGDQSEILTALVEFATGFGELQSGEMQGRDSVLTAIDRCAALGFERFLLPLPRLAAEAARFAWAAGRQTEFITRAIRSRRLVPGDPTESAWPWRLQVHVLGTERILRDGHPLAAPGKRPKKPLQLLALLAAHGRQAVAIDTAIELLWSTADADAPKAALEVALARLRKLLDVPGVVLLTDGKLHLDERIVWSDMAAFETHERTWLDGSHAPSADTRDKAIESAKAAIALYRGELLAGEDLSPAWQMLRDRLARRFSRLVTGCGGLLESQGRWSEACDVYEHGIACSALAEPIYRALMRVQLQLGERAEALRTYSLCRDALRASLGVAPTHETMLLHDLASHTGDG